MKFTKFLFIVSFVIGCDSTDEPTPSKEPFSVLINGELFTPDRSGSASYYNGRLGFGAIDTIDRVGNDEKFQIFFTILNPELGINSIDNFNNTSSIQLYRWIGRQGVGPIATSGEFQLTEFDTINGFFSGSFNCIFDYPDHDIYYELTDGQFNDFTLSELFCEPELSFEEPDSISLFNNWGLIGFKNSDGSYSYPPCGTESRIKITQDLTENSIAYFQGKGPINSFSFKHQILENNTFITDGIATTRVGGSEWQLDYEGDFISFLSNDIIKINLDGDRLILTNKASDSQLVL
ncbi:META domain-containing protein [Reichenbachiella carrageenanivorans]|uniref:META domain-containing protein n=1 Tax=Reichenbachiella carrageenanivorans TaxID=2979869 RepID=A0ABY6D1G3_9BACT|nr:META domain-containing protein [Reichenbachiella carrageenanivorans]UXX79958.1 META domain-containing protein [Reichenbachiella carrageenanivorans]